MFFFLYKIYGESVYKNGNYIILDIKMQEYLVIPVALFGPNEDSTDRILNLREKVYMYE